MRYVKNIIVFSIVLVNTDSSDSTKESSTHVNHDIMTDCMNQYHDTSMKLSHDKSMQTSEHNRMTTRVIEIQSQTDLVKSRNKQVTLNSSGTISMETDDKQELVAIRICSSIEVDLPQTTICESKAPIYSNLFTYNKHNFTSEILKNVCKFKLLIIPFHSF